jgi:hypothetical protein
MRRNIRLARLPDFFSDASSLIEGDGWPCAVDGGEKELALSRLDTERLLLTDRGRPILGELACVDGGRDEDLAEDVAEGSIVIDLRRSAKDDRRSLIMSLTTVIDERRSFLPSFDVFEFRRS